ncbi:hypothetical protein ACF06N_28610 [Streptomyces albidoflavus]
MPLLEEEQMVDGQPGAHLDVAVHPRPAQHQVELVDEVATHVVG